jgi:hypothetical protein
MAKFYFDDERVLLIKNAKEADADALGGAILALRDKYGEIKPQFLWKEAKDNPDHPAYRHFDWNEHEAAEKWWTHQARAIIRLIRIDDPNTGKQQQAFVSITVSDEPASYRPLSEVLESADLIDRLLAQAQRDIEAFQHRYDRFKEIAEDAARIREKIVASRARARKKEKEPELQSA